MAYTAHPQDTAWGRRRRVRYEVETFMFVPRVLGLSPATYSDHAFYADTTAFLRLKTPSIPLDDLAQGATPWFEEARSSEHALRVLGAIFRGALRATFRPLTTELLASRSLNGDAAERMAARVRREVNRAERALEHLRALRPGPDAPGKLQGPWAAVDEYVTLVAEELLTEVVDALDRLRDETHEDVDPGLLGDEAEADPGGASLRGARAVAAQAAVRAYRHRAAAGYRSVVQAEGPNEAFPHHRRVLKRYVFSALYLDVRQGEEGVLARQVAAGIAAGLAMLLTVLVTLWARARWPNTSAAFVTALVVSYIFKDRLKELARGWLGRRVMPRGPAQVLEIRAPHGGPVLGSCRERVEVTDASRLPPDVLALRHADHPTAVAEEGRPETVVRYVKRLSLDRAALAQFHRGFEGVNDVIRFNFGRLRARMDDPEEPYRYVHPETGRLETTICSRVYHVNLLLRSKSDAGEESSEHVRVILDRRGIRRVEDQGSAEPNT